MGFQSVARSRLPALQREALARLQLGDFVQPGVANLQRRVRHEGRDVFPVDGERDQIECDAALDIREHERDALAST